MAETPGRPLASSDNVTSSPAGAAPAGDRDEPAVDRAAAFAAGPPRFPRKVVVVAVAAFVVLGLGGVALDRLFRDRWGRRLRQRPAIIPHRCQPGR